MPLGTGTGLIQSYRRNVFFINNNMLALYNGLLKSFSTRYNEEFHTFAISTYETFIQNIEQQYENQQNTGDEYFQPILPALALDPLGDFSIPDYAADLWRLPYLEGGPQFASAYFMNTTNIQTEHFRMTIVPVKYKINMSAIVVADSQTKMTDLYHQTLLLFQGGFNRPIRLDFIESDLILPTSLMEDYYVNDTSGEHIVVYDEMKDKDFNPNTEYPQYIGRKVMKQLGGKEFYFIPFLLDPILRLDSITQEHDKYSTDAIHKWSFLFNFSCEVNLPSFTILDVDHKLEKINFSMNVGETSEGLIPAPIIKRTKTYIPNYLSDSYTEKVFDTSKSEVLNIVPSIIFTNKDTNIEENDPPCSIRNIYPFKSFRLELVDDVNSENPLIFNILNDFNIAEFTEIIIASRDRNSNLDNGNEYYVIKENNEDYLKIIADLLAGDMLYILFYK